MAEDKPDDERKPHVSTCVRCSGCGHLWVAVVESLEVANFIECPLCGERKGKMMSLFPADRKPG